MAIWEFRLGFIIKTLKRFLAGQDTTCPHCRSHNTKLIDTKYIILQLMRCIDCGLMFRYPKDDVQTNIEFYQKSYCEGSVSETPSDKALKELIDSSFAETGVCCREHIQIIKLFKQGGTLLDYGCSWGYRTWQFQRAGFESMGFEISKPRASFGSKKLSVKIISSYADLNSVPNNSFNVIYTNHVLEHLPNLFCIFKEFYRLLRDDGIIIIFVPNSTGYENKEIRKSKMPAAFGEKHTLAFDDTFFEINLPKYGFEVRCFSSPYKILDNPFRIKKGKIEASGPELMVIGRKKKISNIKVW
ncbi:MAG: class I SAM-dependent methyltransferase [Candidatus Thermoplasmatota archaeon]|nr:class I SAM-dependent methyltransferase [Candidatus Thermoplasmatota archaeon]MCG2827559.1 class I SAM-dependent methyltransferase [Thermoplasmatales archaeon]